MFFNIGINLRDIVGQPWSITDHIGNAQLEVEISNLAEEAKLLLFNPNKKVCKQGAEEGGICPFPHVLGIYLVNIHFRPPCYQKKVPKYLSWIM